MAKILFLAHRVPFPPDKGDKIRAFHMLTHLATRHEVWLGATADDAADLDRLPGLGRTCVESCIVPLGRLRRARNMLGAALSGAPLSVARFRHPNLARWIGQVLREVRPDLVFVYSSALAQYVLGRLPGGSRLLVDFVDADAQKWRTYAETARPPACWIYGAEARRLIRFEQQILAAAVGGILVSGSERDVQARLLGGDSAKLRVVQNGVDVDFFEPDAAAGPASDIVFCGRMDYAPNIDGVEWFARDILPIVRTERPEVVFRIVGAAPVAQVRGLAAVPGVQVTGTVPDVRPYLAAAAVVVAPLRIARGVQNKVLEGLAAGRPVVATPRALEGIAAEPGREILVDADAAGFASAVLDVLAGRAPADLGARGRAFVVRRHRWAAQLAALDRLVDEALGATSGEAAA